MKYKTKKALIASSIILVPSIIIGTSFAIYFSTSTPERISKKGIYTMRINEVLNNEGYKYDLSTTYGSPQENNRTTLLLNNQILHLKSEGQFEYDPINKKIKSPSYQYLKFSNADALVLTFLDKDVTKSQYESPDFMENNKDKYFHIVFDSDDAEIKPDNNDNLYIVQKTSDNKKSINSKQFREIIKNGYLSSKYDFQGEPDFSNKNFMLVSFGVMFDSKIKNGDEKNKWVDSNGNKTKYDICAEDMYYSLMRTKLFDEKYRHKNGGSEELDKYFINKTQTTKMLIKNQKFPNEYLFDFLGINKDYLYDKQKAIKKINVNDEYKNSFTFSFNVWKNNETLDTYFIYSINEIIDKYISNSLLFSLAPSQYIEENLAKLDSTPVGKIKGQAKEFGIYTYAQTRNSTLYSSYFIPTYSQGRREIFEYNKHHADKDWVKSVKEGEVIKNSDGKSKSYKNINKVIIEYTNGIDTSTFINQSFTSFLNGSISKLDYSLLSDAQKQKLYGTGNKNQLITNSWNNGLKPTKKINVSNLTTRMVWQANPIDGSDYSFNSTYSKLMYGVDSNDLKNGTAVTTSAYYSGFGFLFRNLIQSSINWNEYISQAYNGVRDVWLSGAAQNAKFSSFDIDSKTPADYFKEGVNDLNYFNYDSNKKEWVKEIVTLKKMIELSAKSAEEIEKEYGTKDVQKRKMQSPNFEAISKSMTKLLDDFYKQNNIDKNQKIEFEIAYPFADQNEDKSKATEDVVEKVINELDPRIKAKFLKPTSRDEMLTAINKRRGAFNANLWSYDYEGIGSFLAAFISDGGGTNIVNAFGLFSKDTKADDKSLFEDKPIDNKTIKRTDKKTLENLKKVYPLFSELSKYVREEMNKIIKEEWKLNDEKYLVENWDLINNKENNHIITFFNNNNPVVELSKIFKKFEFEASWEQDNKLSKDQKGQKWVDLIREYSSIKGVSIDTESSCDKLDEINYALFLREYIVPLSKFGLQLYQDIKYEVEN